MIWIKRLVLLSLLLVSGWGGWLQAESGKASSITGTARDAKGGAVVVTNSGDPVYVSGLESWPASIHGKKVEVTGRLSQKKIIPDPVVGPDGARTQGAVGSQTVIENAKWELIRAKD